MSRLNQHGRVYFVEEPIFDPSFSERLEVTKKPDGMHIIVPRLHPAPKAESDKKLNRLLRDYLTPQLSPRYVFWFYSPMFLPVAEGFSPNVTVYDCMDELSHFKGAPAELKELEVALLKRADVVFTGGRSLYEAKKDRHHNIHCFPSSIDKKHFMKARLSARDPHDQQHLGHPRFGFYGVIDERFDLNLLELVATVSPSWEFIIIGPVVKIDPRSLPSLPNIHYLGNKDYSELPHYLGHWDVAIMPFAINDSTKYISPTKTPEYLAGGKPVVSTAITDVIHPYESAELVHIGRNAIDFLEACQYALAQKNDADWLNRVDEFLKDMCWDRTAENMRVHLNSIRSDAELDIAV